MIDPETGQRLQHYSARTRHNFKRQDKVLAKHFQGDVAVKLIVSAEELDYFIREASRIVEQSYQKVIGIGVRANDEEQRTYLYKLAEEGILRAYLLVTKGEAIAYVLGTIQSGIFGAWSTSYLSAYSKLSPGTILLRRVMDLLVDEGALLFDFGAGESDYKRILGSHQINEADLKLYARRIQPTITYALDFSFMRLNRWLNKFLRRVNVQNILRQQWRKKLINKKTKQ
ncbi:MAG: GNAT family N-acetyltransferase [Thioploca sp.]|nr:GNAT family N-acetyltransferase [Thioploca sp.]